MKELQPETGRDEILIQLMLRGTQSPRRPCQPRREAQQQRLPRPAHRGPLLHRPRPTHLHRRTARRLGASPSKLRQAFQDVRGESPRACLRRLRCQQALHWLQNSTHSLETISALCGFDSASHLSRVIYQEMGQRPGKLWEARPRQVVENVSFQSPHRRNTFLGDNQTTNASESNWFGNASPFPDLF